jgi:serralysin
MSTPTGGVNVNLATRRGFGGTAEGDTLFDIENLYGSSYYDILTGNDQANTIYAGDGGGWIYGGGGADTLWGSYGVFDDFLDGGTGADEMRGGRGNDNYYVDSRDDVVIERSGEGSTDRIYKTTTYYLGHDSHVEMLIIRPTATEPLIQLYGNNFDNRLIGNDAANVLSGGGGLDTLIGNGGSDLYVIQDARAVITESGGEGDDRAICYVSYTLTPRADVEEMATGGPWGAGTDPIDLTGNETSQTITGNQGNNRLNGGDGNDVLWGDIPVSPGGSDTFVFNTSLNATSNVDDIGDFGSGDMIELDDSVFGAFATGPLAEDRFVIDTVLQANDNIIYRPGTGELLYDSDGNGSAATPILFARVVPGTTLTHEDFVVV